MGEYWTPSDLTHLKKEYAKAVAEGKEVFKFNGHDVLVEHVKVLIQILTERFKGKRNA